MRRGEGKGQRQLLLLLKLLLKRCLRLWEEGKDEFPEVMAAAARRLANAASTAGIVSSPDARNEFMPRDPTRLIPATRERNGGEEGVGDGERIPLPRSAHGQDHGLDEFGLAKTTTKAKDSGSGSGRDRGRRRGRERQSCAGAD